MFLDKAKIFVKAGKGGDGCVSFRREKYVPYGGPDGGDGGKGGDVILKSDENIDDLREFIFKRVFKAERGKHGQGKGKHGKNGADLIINLPLGTMVKDAETGEVIGDLVSPDQTLTVARGGSGGRGNKRFASSTNQAPRWAEKGEPGEEKEIILELKLIADVGLVGLPNAGKSTLLAALSHAKPKIAQYPFTTLSPNVGIVKERDFSFRLADLPGLIKGAHQGVGLGIEFLRHIERTKILLYLIDLSKIDLANPLEDFNLLREEIRAYNPHLLEKPYLLAGNKLDLKQAQENYEEVKKICSLYPISALKKTGLKPLTSALFNLLSSLEKEKEKEEKPAEELFRYTYQPPFTITLKNNIFFVQGKRLKKLVSMIDFENKQALFYFHQQLKRQGIIKSLKKMGIKEKQTVDVEGYQFKYEEK
jgi:GTP-binding protein